jgi:hypothetical protein
MNREILFRGLRTDGKGWVYGCLVIVEQSCFIHRSEKRKGSLDDFIWQESVEVLPSSVGQFTGAPGKNVDKVWKGDKVDVGDGVTRVVVWDDYDYGFTLSPIYEALTFGDLAARNRLYVTGNIHEGGNP